MKLPHLFQRFYLLLLACLLVYLVAAIFVRHGWTTLGPVTGVLVLMALAMLISIAAYPLARRMSGRLDRLRDAVHAFGAGDLGRRAVVEGNDEIAALARGFNEAGERIEHLLRAHRQLLANASHELRTPLARIRLGIELLEGRDDTARRDALVADLRELDELIGEILLSSRLDADLPLMLDNDVDVLGLVAEEASRDADVEVQRTGGDGDTRLAADPRLLRRLVRNLLDNARRHGRPPVLAVVTPLSDTIELCIEDSGTGIDPADRSRVFEPFYRSRAHLENVGSGLGLALVQQIATRHGGSVLCEVGASGGARFVVTLPRSGRAS